MTIDPRDFSNLGDSSGSPLQSFLGGTSNVFDAIDAFMTDNTIDVMFKCFAFVSGLVLLYFIPATKKFAIYAALAIFLILMIQSSPNANISSQPPTSSQPLPTQINTPVPPTTSGASGSSSQSSSGGGFNPLTLIPIIGSFFGF